MSVSKTRFDRPHRPIPIAVANRVGRLFGYERRAIDVGQVLDKARTKVGFRDFGDQGFLEPLEVMIDAINREAKLHPVGRAMIEGRVVGVLANRLVTEDAIRKNPEILDVRIEAPIVVAGLARTGTTMLHRLIAADPSMRSLASWESINPAPRAKPPARGPDPRVAQAAMVAKGLKYMSPGFFAIHPAEADAPEEEVILLEQSFLTTTPESMMDLPSFARWLRLQDHRPAYRFLKRMMQYLQYQRPGPDTPIRWVLKTPHHLEFLDPLLEIFPDATIVQTHRDPLRSSPSLFSMITHLRQIFSDDVDPHRVATQCLDTIERMVRCAMATRERVADHGFVDVSYYDLLDDPVHEVERVYQAAGKELSGEARAAMEASRQTNRQHKYGTHKYALSDFGMTSEDVESRIRHYRAHFGVPYE